ncbi:MAG: hypothetical protein WCJ30_25680, partial [Deltaproteobacteria bacterium]
MAGMAEGIGLMDLASGMARRGVSVAPESALFVALLVAEALRDAPGAVTVDSVRITGEGGIDLPARRGAPDEPAAVASIVAVCEAVLQPPTAQLRGLIERVRKGQVASVESLRAELESLLVPLNRGAAKRVLGRFVREHARTAGAAPKPDTDRERSSDRAGGTSEPAAPAPAPAVAVTKTVAKPAEPPRASPAKQATPDRAPPRVQIPVLGGIRTPRAKRRLRRWVAEDARHIVIAIQVRRHRAPHRPPAQVRRPDRPNLQPVDVHRLRRSVERDQNVARFRRRVAVRRQHPPEVVEAPGHRLALRRLVNRPERLAHRVVGHRDDGRYLVVLGGEHHPIPSQPALVAFDVLRQHRQCQHALPAEHLPIRQVRQQGRQQHVSPRRLIGLRIQRIQRLNVRARARHQGRVADVDRGAAVDGHAVGRGLKRQAVPVDPYPL